MINNENSMDQVIIKAQTLIEALPFIQKFRGKNIVVKYGGSAMLDEDLKYNEAKMNQDIETYGLLDYSYFEDLIPYDVYVAFNGKYLGIAMAKGIVTEEDLLYYIERYSQYW